MFSLLHHALGSLIGAEEEDTKGLTLAAGRAVIHTPTGTWDQAGGGRGSGETEVFPQFPLIALVVLPYLHTAFSKYTLSLGAQPSSTMPARNLDFGKQKGLSIQVLPIATLDIAYLPLLTYLECQRAHRYGPPYPCFLTPVSIPSLSILVPVPSLPGFLLCSPDPRTPLGLALQRLRDSEYCGSGGPSSH